MKHYFANSIGVTGGFASGKSTVAKSLAKIVDYCFFDADAEVALLLDRNAEGWLALHGFLDSIFFHKNGDLNKVELRKAIFVDDILRKKVEGALHPLVRKILKAKIDAAYLNDKKKSVIEVPLLYEANWQDDFNLVVVVSVSEQNAIERAMKRDGVTREQAEKAISVQVSLKKKVTMADYVIDNNQNWTVTMKQLVELKKMLTLETLQPSIK